MIKKSDLDRKNIKKIDTLLKTINKSVYDYNKEIFDFNEEIENNILIEINDLIESGLSENIAVENVINNFGSKKDFSFNLIETFNQIYFKRLLNISFLTSIIASFLLLIDVFCHLYIYIYRSETSFIYINYFNNELFRYNIKLFLILYALSIILFSIWSVLNSILIKRSKNFLLKIIPIIFIGILDLIFLLRISIGSIGNENLFYLINFFVIFSLITIPFWSYILIRKTIMH